MSSARQRIWPTVGDTAGRERLSPAGIVRGFLRNDRRNNQVYTSFPLAVFPITALDSCVRYGADEGIRPFHIRVYMTSRRRSCHPPNEDVAALGNLGHPRPSRDSKRQGPINHSRKWRLGVKGSLCRSNVVANELISRMHVLARMGSSVRDRGGVFIVVQGGSGRAWDLLIHLVDFLV